MPESHDMLVVKCTISNIRTGATMTKPFHVDSGCSADLMLLSADIDALGIIPFGEPAMGCQADGSSVKLVNYEQVNITLTFDDGKTTATTTATPTIIDLKDSTIQLASAELTVSAETAESRLLGYSPLYRLGLKLDYRNHRLVKIIRRV